MILSDGQMLKLIFVSTEVTVFFFALGWETEKTGPADS